MITPAGSFIDNPSSGGGAAGVSSLNSETGAVVIVAGSGITVTPAGQNITIAATGGGGTSFGRNIIAATTYTTLASDIGKVLDIQTSSATTVTIGSQVFSTPAFVQARSSTFTSTGSSVALAFTSNNAAGNFIVVMAGGIVGTGVGVTDTNGNTYHQIYLDTATYGSGNARTAWYALNCAGGANTVTVSWTGTPTFSAGLCIAEYSGVALTFGGAPDQSAGATGSGSPWTTASITTTQSEELILAFGTEGNGSTTGPAAPFTQRATISSSSVVDAMGERVVSATGSYSATGTGAGGSFSTWIASFKAFLVSSTFFSGFIQNDGTSIVTITTQTGLINGKASIVLEPGQGCAIGTDGTNFTAVVTAYLGADEIPYTAGSLDDEFLGTSLSGSWTQVNFTGSAATAVSKSLLSFTADGVADKNAAIVQTAPATPWTVVAKITAASQALAAGYRAGSILVIASGSVTTSKCILFSFKWGNSGSLQFGQDNFTNITTYSSTPNTVTPVAGSLPPTIWIKLANDGTTFTFSYSVDGTNYWTLWTYLVATFTGTIGNVGLNVAGTSTAPTTYSFDYFRRTV